VDVVVKTRAVTGLAAIVSAVLLIGASGPTAVVGWAMWAVGVVVLMSAVPGTAEAPAEPAPERTPKKRAAKRYSLVP
jgi:hypothetical protein